MSEAIAITKARAEDCERCAELLVQQLAEHGISATKEQLLPILVQVVNDSRLGFLIVARAGAQVIGVAYAATLLSAEHCGYVSSLEELYVAPEFRAQGVGTALLAAVLQEAAARGIVAVELEVDATHLRAASLYTRFGFHRLDRSRWLLKIPV